MRRVVYIVIAAIGLFGSASTFDVNTPTVLYHGLKSAEMQIDYDLQAGIFDLTDLDGRTTTIPENKKITYVGDWPQPQAGVYYIGSCFDGRIYWTRIEIGFRGERGREYTLGPTVHLPMWIPATMSGILLIMLIVIPLCRFIHRRRLGKCTRCGYCLRESPLGCPECGYVRKSKASAKPFSSRAPADTI